MGLFVLIWSVLSYVFAQYFDALLYEIIIFGYDWFLLPDNSLSLIKSLAENWSMHAEPIFYSTFFGGVIIMGILNEKGKHRAIA